MKSWNKAVIGLLVASAMALGTGVAASASNPTTEPAAQSTTQETQKADTSKTAQANKDLKTAESSVAGSQSKVKAPDAKKDAAVPSAQSQTPQPQAQQQSQPKVGPQSEEPTSTPQVSAQGEDNPKPIIQFQNGDVIRGTSWRSDTIAEQGVLVTHKGRPTETPTGRISFDLDWAGRGGILTITATAPNNPMPFKPSELCVVDGGVCMRGGHADHNDNADIRKIVFNGSGKTVFPEDSSHYFENVYFEANGPVSDAMEVKPGSVDFSKVRNASYMFANSMSERDLGEVASLFDMSHVTDMTGMFAYSGNLFNHFLDVSKLDTSSVTNMSDMFRGYGSSNGLVFVTLGGKFDTSHVTDMSGMFSNTRFYGPNPSAIADSNTYKPLELDKLDTSNVTDMSDMFRGSNISRFVITSAGKFDTSKVTTMRGMFKDATNMHDPDFSLMDTSNVTDMRDMFNAGVNYDNESYDSVTESMTFGGKFVTTKVTNMSGMFAYQDHLKALDVSGFNTSKVTDMNSMFFGCRSIKSLDVSNFDTSKVTNMAGMFGMGQNYYGGARSELKTLKLGDNFDTSQVTDMSYMFEDDASLGTLDLSKFDTSKVTNMAEMFLACGKLTEIDVSKFDVDAVRDADAWYGGVYDMFYGTAVKKLDLSNWRAADGTVLEYLGLPDTLHQISVGPRTRLGNRDSLSSVHLGGTWIQLAVPATASSSVNMSKTYTVEEMSQRTQSADPARVGTYVRQQESTDQKMTLKGNAPTSDYIVTPNQKAVALLGTPKVEDVPAYEFAADGHVSDYKTTTVPEYFKDALLPENPFTLAIKQQPDGLADWYVFKEWNSKSDGTGDSYAPGITISAKASDVLYAVWTKIPDGLGHYSIKYEANKPTGAASEITGQTADDEWSVYKTDASTDLLHQPREVKLNGYTLEGYTFQGWNTLANPTASEPGTAYTPGSTVQWAPGTTKLYAQWKANPVDFTVHYEANSPAGQATGSISDDNIGAEAGTPSHDFTVKANAYAVSGWKFTGWNTKANGQGTAYKPGDTVNVAANTTTTLYAQWRKIKSADYCVWYYGNDGDAKAIGFPNQTSGCIVPPRGINLEPSHGDAFTANDANDEDLNNYPYKVRVADANKYWFQMKDDWHVIGFTDDNGTFYKEGDSVKIKPKKNVECHMVGWRPVCTGAAPSGKLYAQWGKDVDYQLNYDSNAPAGHTADGSGTANETVTRSVRKSDDLEHYTSAAAANGWTVDGWMFNSWNTAADGTGTTYAPGNQVSLLKSKPTTLYAQWKATSVPVTPVTPSQASYEVRYNANAPQGTFASGIMDVERYTLKLGENGVTDVMKYPDYMVKASGYAVAGYEFKGWNTKSDGTGESYAPGNKLDMEPGVIQFYAQWGKATPKPNPSKPTTPNKPGKPSKPTNPSKPNPGNHKPAPTPIPSRPTVPTAPSGNNGGTNGNNSSNGGNNGNASNNSGANPGVAGNGGGAATSQPAALAPRASVVYRYVPYRVTVGVAPNVTAPVPTPVPGGVQQDTTTGTPKKKARPKCMPDDVARRLQAKKKHDKKVAWLEADETAYGTPAAWSDSDYVGLPKCSFATPTTTAVKATNHNGFNWWWLLLLLLLVIIVSAYIYEKNKQDEKDNAQHYSGMNGDGVAV